MDVTAFLLVTSILVFALASGALVWRLTPDRPRIHMHAAEPGGAVPSPAASPWANPHRPAHVVDEPHDAAGEERGPSDDGGTPDDAFAYVGRARGPSDLTWKTRVLGLVGMIASVLIGAATITGGVVWMARLIARQIQRYVGE